MALGAIIVGLGFGIPSLIYQVDRLAKGMQSLIHMAIGLMILTIVSFAAGWIPSTMGLMGIFIYLGLEMLCALICWLFFYLHFKKEAQRMNAYIQDKK
jgi:hypothetical protein